MRGDTLRVHCISDAEAHEAHALAARTIYAGMAMPGPPSSYAISVMYVGSGRSSACYTGCIGSEGGYSPILPSQEGLDGTNRRSLHQERTTRSLHFSTLPQYIDESQPFSNYILRSHNTAGDYIGGIAAAPTIPVNANSASVASSSCLAAV